MRFEYVENLTTGDLLGYMFFLFIVFLLYLFDPIIKEYVENLKKRHKFSKKGQTIEQ